MTRPPGTGPTWAEAIGWGIIIVFATCSATFTVTRIIDQRSVIPTGTATAPSDSTIILFGSGTVGRYLKDKFPEWSVKDNPVIFSGPSIVASHVFMRHELSSSPTYKCILMSSTYISKDNIEKEDQLEFQRRKKDSRDDMRIVALKLSDDNMRVGLFLPDAKPFKALEGGIVRDSLLMRLVMQCDTSEYDTYVTSDQSGTITEYRNMFHSLDTTFSDFPGTMKYFDVSRNKMDAIMAKNKPALFLCSESYSTKEMTLLYINDAKNHICKRPLYLYFIVQEYSNIRRGYTITGSTGQFLSTLKNRLIESSPKGSSVFIRKQKDDIFIELDIADLEVK